MSKYREYQVILPGGKVVTCGDEDLFFKLHTTGAIMFYKEITPSLSELVATYPPGTIVELVLDGGDGE